MKIRRFLLFLFTVQCSLMLTAVEAGAQTDETVYFRAVDSLMTGSLISSETGMETAWDLPRNPLVDSLPSDRKLAEQIKLGFRIFQQTVQYAPRFSGNGLSCGNCHLNAGQREKALPLTGVAASFPEYNKRSARLFSLEDRIVGCFTRSMNSVRGVEPLPSHDPSTVEYPLVQSEEVLALAAYITWLSDGHKMGSPIPWRGLNTLSPDSLIPVGKLDSARGRGLYVDACANCHGDDGQGLAIGDIKPGPLWGPDSWNDGAGAARVYTLAGMIRHMMPYANPGNLTDADAQNVAYFICTQPRPVYPFKSHDYKKEKLPPDALYYTGQSGRQ